MPSSFTPQQIEQFLQEFFDVVGARQYIGARYVPIFGRAGEDTVEWDDLAPYEPLTVVMHEGVSYVSRRYVPTGIQIDDTEYWVETYRFNAQVEQYRQEVLSFQGQIDQIREDMESDYVPFPDPATYPKYGLLGQVLTTLTGGETKWEDPVTVTADVAEPLIEDWLDTHPEATTTVEDGAITWAKLNASLTRRLVHSLSISSAEQAQTLYDNLLSNIPTYSAAYIDTTWFNDRPTGLTGTAFIISLGDVDATSNSFGVQVLLSCANDNRIFYRGKRNQAQFNSWVEFDANNLYKFFTYPIQSTDDLNNFTTKGFYYAPAGNTTQNAPTTAAFFMRVDVSGNVISQTVYQITGNFRIHNRIKISSSAWYAWRTNAIEDQSVTRSKLNDSLLNALLHQLSVSSGTATSEYSNMASNLPPYSCAYIAAGWFNDLPSGLTGTGHIITIGNVAEDAYGAQILLSANDSNTIFYRGKRYEEQFNEWVKFDANYIYSYFTTPMQSSDTIDDFVKRGFYYAATGETPTNAPTTAAFFMRVDVSGSVISQTVYQITGNFCLYERYKIGSNAWSAWKTISRSLKNANGKYYAFGDSTTKGQIGGGQTTPYGYPRIVADNLEITFSNMGVGGQGLCKDWDTINSTIDGLDMSDATLITVGWGYNDGSTWATLNRGDYTDTTDTTVIGRYYTIMKKLQQKCKNAVVILVTTYGSPGALVDGKASLVGQFTNNITFLDRSTSWGDFFDELEKMCHLHGWPCINQHKNCALNEFNAPLLLADQVHPNVNGYWVYGNNLAAQIGACYANIIPRDF